MRYASNSYAQPEPTAVAPPSAQSLTDTKMKIQQILDSDVNKEFDELELVHLVKIKMIKTGENLPGWAIRQCILELVGAGDIQQTTPTISQPEEEVIEP